MHICWSFVRRPLTAVITIFERVDVLSVILNDRNKLLPQPNVEHYVINEARVTHGSSSSDLVSRLMKGGRRGACTGVRGRDVAV